MATCEQKQAWLTAAEDAYHALQMGGEVKSLATGTKSITYSSANIGDLVRYINGLRAQVDACLGRGMNARRIIGFIPSDSGNCY